MLIHGFSPVNARLLTVYGTAFYAIKCINVLVKGASFNMEASFQHFVYFANISTNHVSINIVIIQPTNSDTLHRATFLAKYCPFVNKFGARSHFKKSQKHKDVC